MRSAVVLFVVATFILSACAPVAAPRSTVPLVPSKTPAPSATSAATGTPTRTPTATPTPIPTLPPEQVGGLTGVPDPRYSNPELFDLNDPNAPIPQFINAMRMAGVAITAEQVLREIQYVSGNQGLYVYAVTSDTGNELSDGICLLIATRKADKWVWNRATPRLYWQSMGGKEIGTVLEWYRAYQDSNYLATIRADFNHFSLNTEFIWKYLYADGNYPNQYTLTQVDEALQFAQANDMSVDLEGFTWGFQLPDWLTQRDYTQGELIEILNNHMDLLKRYRGRFRRVNVVSEPFGNVWEPNYWSSKLGVDTYLQVAFRAARESEPDAILTLVDISDSDELYDLVRRLNENERATNDTRLIDGVGFEMPFFLPGSNINVGDYLDPGRRANALEKFRHTIRRYREIGVDVYITEMLVDLTDVPGSMEEKLTFQAHLYRDFLRICVEEGISVTLYSFYDGQSVYPQGAGRPYAAPYLRNAEYKPKPSYYSLLSIFLLQK